MNYNTVYVGMDVHKESFSLCCYTNEKEQPEYFQKVEGHYSKTLNYLETMRFHYGDDAVFICGYEVGCLGFTLYHQLTGHNVKCVILAPTTMLKPVGKKKVKTDKRDATLIARCLAHHDYSSAEKLNRNDCPHTILKCLNASIIAFSFSGGHFGTRLLLSPIL